MKYTDWITELKANLLSVSEAERRRVLDYYAEAYADRRTAGFSETEIIDGFGAPYDAAQAILDGEKFEESSAEYSTRTHETGDSGYSAPPPLPSGSSHSATASAATLPSSAAKKNDNTWVFVLLCIVLAVPIFVVTVTLASLTISIAVTPIAMIVSGGAQVGLGIGLLFGGEIAYGITNMGMGLIIVGIGVIIMKLCFMLVKLMWKLFVNFFKWLAKLFKGDA